MQFDHVAVRIAHEDPACHRAETDRTTAQGNAGGRQQGLLPLKNFETPPEAGTVLDVMVSRFNAADGFYELVLPGGTIDVGDWSEVAEGMVVEARVTGHNKGGLECEVNRLRGFIPAGQISVIFGFTTSPVAVSATVVVTATVQGVGTTVTLTLGDLGVPQPAVNGTAAPPVYV